MIFDIKKSCIVASVVGVVTLQGCGDLEPEFQENRSTIKSNGSSKTGLKGKQKKPQQFSSQAQSHAVDVVTDASSAVPKFLDSVPTSKGVVPSLREKKSLRHMTSSITAAVGGAVGDAVSLGQFSKKTPFPQFNHQHALPVIYVNSIHNSKLFDGIVFDFGNKSFMLRIKIAVILAGLALAAFWLCIGFNRVDKASSMAPKPTGSKFEQLFKTLQPWTVALAMVGMAVGIAWLISSCKNAQTEVEKAKKDVAQAESTAKQKLQQAQKLYQKAQKDKQALLNVIQ